MTRNSRVVLLAAAAVLVVLLSFGAGSVSTLVWVSSHQDTYVSLSPVGGSTSAGTPSADVQKDLNTFWEAWNIVSKEFYGRPVDEQKMVYGAAKGMVSALGDDYTVFVTPDENKLVHDHMSGRFEGIGVYVEMKQKHLTVIQPIQGSPAEKVGIQAGDVIVKVDGKDISDMALDAAVALIKGPKGTQVKVSVARGNTESLLEFTMVRSEINAPSLYGKMLPNGIAYINLEVFGDNTPNEFDQELGNLLKDKPKGVILDLRNNGGGYVEGALQVLGRFIPKGVALYEDTDRNPDTAKPADVKTGDVKAYDVPLVVLVNGGTASASEIVAGALQDYKRATIVGEKTFGKGSVQNVHELEDGASVRVTVAHWLTPNKRQIQGAGLDPDVKVSLTKEDVDAGKDPQLDAAIQQLGGSTASSGQ